MIELYAWPTSNARKVSIMLEEIGETYRTVPIDLEGRQQHAAGYERIHPDRKVPAIVDHHPVPGIRAPHRVFESGAILLYLAEKSGRLLPGAPEERSVCLQWTMFGLTTFGPMLQQAHWFRRSAPVPVEEAIMRYSDEARRLYGVLQARLEQVPYLAGDTYTIADIASVTWVARHEWQGIELPSFPAVERWYRALRARPAVERGFRVAEPEGR